MQYSRELLEKWAPEMLEALQGLLRHDSNDFDRAHAKRVVAWATGHSKPCACRGQHGQCEYCRGQGYVPLPLEEPGL